VAKLNWERPSKLYSKCEFIASCDVVGEYRIRDKGNEYVAEYIGPRKPRGDGSMMIMRKLEWPKMCPTRRHWRRPITISKYRITECAPPPSQITECPHRQIIEAWAREGGILQISVRQLEANDRVEATHRPQ
jgi:hypothetical protein